MHGIRKNCHAVGEQASCKLDERKREIQKECRFDVFYIFMPVIMFV